MDRYEQRSTCYDALYKNHCLLCLGDKGGNRETDQLGSYLDS